MLFSKAERYRAEHLECLSREKQENSLTVRKISRQQRVKHAHPSVNMMHCFSCTCSIVKKLYPDWATLKHESCQQCHWQIEEKKKTFKDSQDGAQNSFESVVDDRSTCSFERINFVWVRRSHWSKGYDTHDIDKQITISKHSICIYPFWYGTSKYIYIIIFIFIFGFLPSLLLIKNMKIDAKMSH